MATDPQSLLSAANLYQGYGASGYQLDLMILALLAQISKQQNPMIATDPQTLLTAASCYQCFGADPYALKLMMLALLAQIVNNGISGGGLGSGIVFGNYGGSQPNFTPASGTGAAFDTSIGRPWFYYNGAWN